MIHGASVIIRIGQNSGTSNDTICFNVKIHRKQIK